MLLIQPVMDIIANLSWIAFWMALRLYLCSKLVWTKERRKTRRIVSWLVHGATAHISLLLNHPPLFFDIRVEFDLYCAGFFFAFMLTRECSKTHCAIVLCSPPATTRHITLTISCIFLLQPSFELKAAATRTKPILWQHTYVCVRVAFSDPTKETFLCFLWVFVSLQY